MLDSLIQGLLLLRYVGSWFVVDVWCGEVY
jgi:hypothetical protein